ncbi:MAG: hypothetical protein ACYDAG_09525 [Chloroflexota bacterium]
MAELLLDELQIVRVAEDLHRPAVTQHARPDGDQRPAGDALREAFPNPPMSIHDVLDVMGKLVPVFSHNMRDALSLVEVPEVVREAERIVSRAIRRRQRH